jgi:hypothetical protein
MKSILRLWLVSRVKDSVLVCICQYMYFFSGVFASIFKVSDHFAQFEYSNQSIKDKIDCKILIISIFSLVSFLTFKFCKSFRGPGS